MEKSSSKHNGLFQPSYWPDSRSDNLPEIFASGSVVVAVQRERKKRCVLPPIVEPNQVSLRRIEPIQPTVENTDNAIGKSGSLNFAQNDRCENSNDYRSRGFLNNRTTATVIDGKVPKRRETMVEGLFRRDTALVSTGQRTDVAVPHSRVRLDAKKTSNEKTVFQGRNSRLPCPTSENVVIEEIYLLSRNRQAVSEKQKSRRQGICDHPSVRETASDESDEVKGIRRCGEILSRRVYYSGSATHLSSSEELGTGVGMTRKSRRQGGICGHPSLRETRSDESNGFRGIRPCGKIWPHRLPCYGAAESEERNGQRMRREKVREGNSEAAGAAESEQEQERPRERQGVGETEKEAKGREEENLAGVVTAASVERQGQRRRRQRVIEDESEARDRDEETLAFVVTAESEEKQEQRRRRNGVCETVDTTAASRRRAKVLKKKLFGEDLPIDYELMIEQTIGRALNKRL